MIGDGGGMYKTILNMAEIGLLRGEFYEKTGKLDQKVAGNAFTIEQRYYDLNSKLDALCFHLGLKIEKQEGYIVVKKR